MRFVLRRLLNHLPLGGGRVQYVKASWHKPTPFDQWTSQAPFRPAQRPPNFGRALRWQRWRANLLRWGLAFLVAWLVLESARGLQLF
jgi:hypothetical protein